VLEVYLEAPIIDTQPKEEDLVKVFEKIEATRERNIAIVKAYQQGYSQHRIAKVLGLNQATAEDHQENGAVLASPLWLRSFMIQSAKTC